MSTKPIKVKFESDNSKERMYYGSLKSKGSGSRKVPSFNDRMMILVGVPIRNFSNFNCYFYVRIMEK